MPADEPVKKSPFVVLLLMLGLPCPLLAHHSVDGRYDRTRTIEISGTVTEAHWINPHTRIVLAGTDGQRWTLEGIGWRYMKPLGVKKEYFAIGSQVTVAGLASRFGLPEVFMGNLLLEGGEEYLLREGATPRWAAEAAGQARK